MNQKITFVFHLDGVSLIDDGSTIKRALSLSDGNLLVSSFVAFYGDRDEEPSEQMVRSRKFENCTGLTKQYIKNFQEAICTK